jgi:hypothetical protein
LIGFKQCRRVATPCDKLAANNLAFIQLASIRLSLRANESARSIAPCHHPGTQPAKRLEDEYNRVSARRYMAIAQAAMGASTTHAMPLPLSPDRNICRHRRPSSPHC